MKSSLSLLALVATLFSAASASVLSTTNIADVLAGAHDQNALTVPAAALAAIKKLGTGGATANTLTASDKTAINDCVSAAQAGNTASKAGLGAGTGSPGNIVFVAAKTTLHACETAQGQVALAAGTTSSDTAVNLLISNVGVLNVNTKAAGLSNRRAVEFVA